MVLHATDKDFDTVIAKGGEPVLVDFWAEWCGPCRMLGSVLEELAAELQGKAHIVKVNIDENPQIANKFGIRSIPTLILFKNGAQLETRVGNIQKSKIKEWIEAAI